MKTITTIRTSVAGILGTMLLAMPAWGQAPPPPAASASRSADTDVVGWWAFDDLVRRGAYDRATQKQDLSVGLLRNATGVLGNGLKCDGLTSCIIRKAAETPKLDGPFAIETWVAPQTYPWNWCPIVAQNRDEAAGYYFGLNADGHVGLLLAVDGQWKMCVSEARLPLLKWSHVAGTFHPEYGISVYINGEKARYLPIVGELTSAEDTDLRIARNHNKKPLAHVIRNDYSIPAAYSFDGLLDEIKIHRGAMTDQAVRAAFVSTRPSIDPDLRPRRLPSGPQDATRFGAFYEQLKYDEGWDALWRGGGPDVVVGFDTNPCRLVLWRGVSYAPCWVTENGKWFSNEFMERSPVKAGGLCGCCESMSDKRAQYSHAKILENSDARAVVYWRYSPCDIRYELPYVDQETGWGDWAEEYHTIYPDGVAVRKIVMHSGNFNDWYEWCQSLPIMQPGETPEDVLNGDDVLSLANMEGESRSYAWPPKGKEVLSGANIQVIHYRSHYWPFLVLWDKNARIWLWNWEPSKHSEFSWWNHWPVAQVASDGRNAAAADRPAHSCTSTQDCAPYAEGDNTQTKIMLCGMTDKKAGGLVPLARSWLRPPRLQLQSSGYHNHGYDPAERAYVLSCDTPDQPPELRVELTAGEDSPLVNLAILTRSWGQRDAALTINGKEVPRGRSFRLGHLRHLTGADLVVWIELESGEPVQVSLATR